MELDIKFVNVVDQMDRNFSMKLGEIHYAEYWDYFIIGKGWPVSDFVSAVESCIEELEFRPKIADILNRRPKKYRTIDDIDREHGVIGGRIEHVSAADMSEIDAMIEKILHNRLRSVCRKLVGNYPKDSQIRHPRHACPECRDKGTIEVYDPRTTYHAARAKTLSGDRIRTILVACECEAGETHREERKPEKKKKARRPMIAFDQKQMCRVTAATTTEQVDEITGFMQEWNPRNYHNEFSDWS